MTRPHHSPDSPDSPDSPVEVDPDQVRRFRDVLGEIHQGAQADLSALAERAGQLGLEPAGGVLPGVQEAWAAMADTVGRGGTGPSLLENLTALDDEIAQHAVAAGDSLRQYTAADEQVVGDLRRAAGASR